MSLSQIARITSSGCSICGVCPAAVINANRADGTACPYARPYSVSATWSLSPHKTSVGSSSDASRIERVGSLITLDVRNFAIWAPRPGPVDAITAFSTAPANPRPSSRPSALGATVRTASSRSRLRQSFIPNVYSMRSLSFPSAVSPGRSPPNSTGAITSALKRRRISARDTASRSRQVAITRPLPAALRRPIDVRRCAMG